MAGVENSEFDAIERKIKMRASMNKKKKYIRSLEVKYGLRKERKKPTSTKILMWAMIAIFFEMILYAEAVMWITRDLSALYALIGIAAAMVALLWAYCTKSAKENTAGGIVYDMAMKEHDENKQKDEESEAQG